jgi:E3 ubiquitin-protein ligase SIAH1
MEELQSKSVEELRALLARKLRTKAAQDVQAPGVDAPAELIKMLECPVCMDVIPPPVWQCPNGHAICETCRVNTAFKCPSCRASTSTDIRCLILEQAASGTHVPCRNKERGCEAVVLYEELRVHLDGCLHRPYRCPFNSDYAKPSCLWEGEASEVATHLHEVHRSRTAVVSGAGRFTYVTGTKELGENLKWISVLRVVDADGGSEQEMLLCFSCHEGLYSASLRHIGSSADASQWTYEIHLNNPLSNRSETWRGPLRSIRLDDRQLTASDDLMSFSTATAETLSWASTEKHERQRYQLDLSFWRILDGINGGMHLHGQMPMEQTGHETERSTCRRDSKSVLLFNDSRPNNGCGPPEDHASRAGTTMNAWEPDAAVHLHGASLNSSVVGS